MRHPAQPVWTHETIKAALRDRFQKTLTAISTEWGYCPQALSHALRRHGYSAPLEAKVAESLGVPAHVLWPFRWSADGGPLPPTSDRQPIQPLRAKTSQNRVAA